MVTLTPTEMVPGVLVIVLAAVAIALFLQRRRSDGLKSRFGPEYERTIAEAGDQRKAEALLHEREKRIAAKTAAALAKASAMLVPVKTRKMLAIETPITAAKA